MSKKKLGALQFTFPLSTILSTVLFFVTVLLFVVIISLFYTQNEKVAQKVATEFEVQASTQTINEFEQYFENAEVALQEVYNLVDQDLIDTDSLEDILGHLATKIRADPLLNALYLADFKGNFYLVKRLPDNSVSSRHVYRTKDSIISRWFHDNPENKYKFPEYSKTSLEEGYDPRKRPWYENADKEEITWSDPYIFFSDKILGITGTRRIILRGFEGVASVDVGLGYLTDFVGKLFLGGKGATLVIDDKDQVIAYQDSYREGAENTEIDYSNSTSILNLKEIEKSKAIVRTLEEAKKNRSVFTRIKQKDLLEILTQLLFPSEEINSLETINVNAKTNAKDFTLDGLRYVYSETDFDLFRGINWKVYFLAKDRVLIGNLQDIIKLGIVILVILFFIVLVFYARFLRGISNKIGKISVLMKNIIPLRLEEKYLSEDRLNITEIDVMGNVYNRVIKSLSSFKKFIPKQVIRRSIRLDEEINVFMEQRKSISILFSDIVSFTSITEQYKPLDLSTALNIYFTELSRIIEEQEGIIDKFIGDAIMAIFGVFQEKGHGENSNHAEKACYAALKMQKAHEFINKQIAEHSSISFKTRIGVNTGPALVGVLGSKHKLSYTALGDSVNVASRLEGLNKEYSTSVIISEATRKLLGTAFLCRKLDSLQVKGKRQATSIYQLYGYSSKKKKSAVVSPAVLAKSSVPAMLGVKQYVQQDSKQDVKERGFTEFTAKKIQETLDRINDSSATRSSDSQKSATLRATTLRVEKTRTEKQNNMSRKPSPAQKAKPSPAQKAKPTPTPKTDPVQ